MSAYKVYNPSTDNTVIKQGRTNLYFDQGSQALYKVVDIQFVNYEWIHLASWKNETDQTNEYEYTFQTTLSITGGEAVNTQWDFVDVLKGLSVVLDGSTSTITEDVISTTANSKVTIRVWPNSSVHLYQKRYSLKPVVWFQLDAANKIWTVGKWKRDGVATVEASVEINASDYLTTTKALFGSGSIYVAPASNIETQTNIKQFQDCTKKCQDYLRSRGVDGT
jgi:hypothetical protein